MTALTEAPATSVPSPVRLKLALVMVLHIAGLCLTFVYVTQYYGLYGIFRFDAKELLPALLNAAPLVLASFVFVIARFSFGYVIGFYLYTMALGYLWLAKFSLLAYDHTLASLSTDLSATALDRKSTRLNSSH